MPRDYRVYLDDILEAITKICQYTRGMTLKTFSKDAKTLDAVVRNLEVIGEAVKKLESGGQQMLESLPDGIHSGLIKSNSRGVFFYFKADVPQEGPMHFWKFFDLKDRRIVDNRYIIANLIACEPDTPRIVDL